MTAMRNTSQLPSEDILRKTANYQLSILAYAVSVMHITGYDDREFITYAKTAFDRIQDALEGVITHS